MARCVVVAIDGPAGAGKSTIARAVARRLGYVYIDTGAMYRAVALWALRNGIAPDDSHKLDELARHAKIEFTAGASTVVLNGEDVTAAIREPEVSDAASKASALPGVRRAMVDAQREMATGSSVVMEGRDIGTVVFPDAAVKIFLDANPDVRATRRVEELRGKGMEVGAETVAQEMADRDRRDRTRTEAPLVQAPDAIYVDTTGLTIEEVEEAVLKVIRGRVSNGKDVVR
ncbi:MAG: (d)CMP kinase [Acidobacteria bacterium]|nr:(d)CMP kinase [Acidobacteriota bacterium]